MKRFLLSLILAGAVNGLSTDVYIINGERVEGEVHEEGGVRTICTETMCLFLPDDAVKVEADGVAAAPNADVFTSPVVALESPHHAPEADAPRLAQGYLSVEEFLSFLKGGAAADGASGETAAESPFAGKAWYGILLMVLFGGLCLNLMPCVLPMMPINLMIIGKSATRGALYGLGIAVSYGALGVMAAVGGLAFGEIQGSPWFNLTIAVLFTALGLSLFGVFMIDFSKHRQGLFDPAKYRSLKLIFPFVMGLVSAVLAGACVAPILIAVLLLTAKLYAGGNLLALGLPFVLGLGMALPWPFAGAGLKVLPKPGAWMGAVNKIFGALVLAFAVWYGWLAYTGFTASSDGLTPTNFSLDGLKRPVLVDCWATWCKNCAAMERTTLADPQVRAALADYTVIKLQCENLKELRALPAFRDVKGLPAYLVFE